jgi:hypothetical protein
LRHYELQDLARKAIIHGEDLNRSDLLAKLLAQNKFLIYENNIGSSIDFAFAQSSLV